MTEKASSDRGNETSSDESSSDQSQDSESDAAEVRTFSGRQVCNSKPDSESAQNDGDGGDE